MGSLNVMSTSSTVHPSKPERACKALTVGTSARTMLRSAAGAGCHCRAWWSAGCVHNSRVEGNDMLWTILVVLVVLWALGLVGHIGGGFIHLLLVIAAIVFIVQLLSGRRTV